MIHVARVHKNWVAPINDRVMGYLKRAWDQGDQAYSMDDILAGIAGGSMQLWVLGDAAGIRGAGVTQFVGTPSKRYCFVELAACDDGLREHWVTQVRDELKAYARAHGCHYLEWKGRRGFERLFRDADYIETVIRWKV